MSILSSLFGVKETVPEERNSEPLDIGQIRGHRKIKQGLLIAAVGRHNILLIGPPGEGKSAILSTLPGFLPSQTQEEYNELRYIHLYANNITDISMSYRPFIQVSSGITESGLIGGGHSPTPGAISLAHSGVLFMDEFAEYPKKLLESLRNPLENKEVTINRGGSQITFPCNIQLVCAMNPCICGYYGYPECKCSENELKKYNNRLSGPILDRIDMVLSLGKVSLKDKFLPYTKNQSQSFKDKVWYAQHFRRANRGTDICNRDIPGHEVFNPESSMLRWGKDTINQYQLLLVQENISTRKSIQLAKIARSIADLYGDMLLEKKHLITAKEFLGDNDND